MLRLTRPVYELMVGHCLDGLPLEACGLLGGEPSTAKATLCYPTDNVAASARLYTVDPRQHLLADRDAEARGLEIIGVFHSHTHTEAFPSPTDVGQAPDPSWHYVRGRRRARPPSRRPFPVADGMCGGVAGGATVGGRT